MTTLRLSAIAFAAALASGCASAASDFDAYSRSGMLTTALDAVNLIQDSVRDKINDTTLAGRANGGALWLDQHYSDVKSKRLLRDDAHTGGHRSRTAMTNLGADIKTGNGMFGVVYSYGHSDTDTRNSDITLDGEAHYYGVTIFGLLSAGPINLTGSAGYVRLSGNSDVATGGTTGIKGNIWKGSVGLNVPFELATIQWMAYADIEGTHITPHNFSGGEPDNALIWQFPIGLKASRDFAVGSFTLRPAADIAVVPMAGDTRQATLINGALRKTRVAPDTLYRAGLGLTLKGQKGEISAKYRYEAGEGGLSSHSGLLSGRYIF